MDGETAVELAKLGSTLLFLGVPQYTLIGIDTQVHSTLRTPCFDLLASLPEKRLGFADGFCGPGL
jgi:hypothetical protein